MDPAEPRPGDAFGTSLQDQLGGGGSAVVIERDDGFVDADGSDYLGDVQHDPLWQWMRPRLGNRVLDLGAGAGRGALRLQSEEVDVVALDVSPGCIDVCRRRGVRDVFLGTIHELAAAHPKPFDSVLALGNNLGLVGSPETAKVFFDAARALGTKDVRIVGTMLNPYLTDNATHLDYHAQNRGAGRLSGHVTIRVRYRNKATPWFSLLWASEAELADLAANHGWEMVDTKAAGIVYAAELRPA